MVEDPIREYSEAAREFDTAYARIKALGSFIADVAHMLNNKPHVFMVSNIDVGFPMELSLRQGVPVLNADQWPSARDIATAIVTLQEKRKKVKEAWHSLSATDKKLVSQLDTQD